MANLKTLVQALRSELPGGVRRRPSLKKHGLEDGSDGHVNTSRKKESKDKGTPTSTCAAGKRGLSQEDLLYSKTLILGDDDSNVAHLSSVVIPLQPDKINFNIIHFPADYTTLSFCQGTDAKQDEGERPGEEEPLTHDECVSALAEQ